MAHFIFFQQCVIDTLSPIIIQLVFSQSESQQEGLFAILNTDSPTQAVVEVRGYILGLTKTCSLTVINSSSDDCGLSTVIYPKTCENRSSKHIHSCLEFFTGAL